jgi:TrmH family RNA methyltransferase
MKMVCKKITSLSNPLIRKAVEAKKRKQGPAEELFLVEGPHLVGMAASASIPITEVFHTGKFMRKEEGKRLLDQLSLMQSPPEMLVEVTDEIISRISDTESSQGIVALAVHHPCSFRDLVVQGELLIVACDGIQDPGNLGTIIRVADAAGADAVVILPGTCDPFSPKTVRATAGSIFNIPIIVSGHSEFLDYLALKVLDLIVTDVRARRSLYESDLRRPLAFVFGNEARGVSETVGSKAAESVRIPIPGKAESLNVAIAAAVCLYETVRQRTG